MRIPHIVPVLTLAIGLGSLVVPSSASACGMRRGNFRGTTRSATDLVASALDNVERGRPAMALGLALGVTNRTNALPADLGRAWAVVGWARWKSGAQAAALEAFGKARALDEDAVDVVLTRARDVLAVSKIRSALAG